MQRSLVVASCLFSCALALGACTDDSDGGGGDGSGDGGTGEGDDGTPDNAYCDSTNGWSPAWAQLEQDVLTLVNQNRAAGADCGGEGQKPAVAPLTMQGNLRCAARKHSQDMDARNYFAHDNPDGESPWDRFDRAGYTEYATAGENIAAGSPDAAGTMAQWMGSDGHCANIMSGDFTEIGIGYHVGGEYGHLWTQTFGRRF